MTPREAYNEALTEGPSDGTRETACQDPYYAYDYARYVDRVPRDDTRAAACRDPEYAYWYARDVDQGPRDDTRASACKHPECAYWYARDIDRFLHPCTAVAMDKIDLAKSEDQLEFS
jgi:hypothetical protein